MTACRARRRMGLTTAALAVAAALAAGGPAGAADTPVGRVVADVIPLHPRVHPPQQIIALLHTRAGVPYDEAVAQEDIRRLHATKWFIPGGVQFHTRLDPDGRVTVYVYVTELTSTVQEVVYVGGQHLSQDKLRTLAGVRKGEPMNPLSNELGRQAILREYQDEGRYFSSVELLEGSKPSDTRVVYQIVEGPVVKVAGIEFRGNSHAAGGRLKEQLTTKKMFAGFIGGTFRPATMDADLKRLTDYYAGLGFLAVKIEPEVARTDDPGKVVVAYHIVEGIQYQVESTDVRGNKSYPTEKLAAMTTVKPGERYDRWKVQRDIRTIEDFHGNRGYRVGVQENVYEVPDQPGVVRVQYEVQGDRGEPARVGRVIIEGNNITQDRVIMNQLDLRPGQVLQYPKLEDARMRLARLGIFDPANPPTVTELPNELDSNFKDILVQVNETRTGQFMIGGGVNSNAGLNGSIVINERNFDIARFPTSWDDFRTGRAFRGAGQELRLEAVPGTQFQRYSATFREPYLFDTQFGFTNSAYYFNRSYVEYFENRIGDRVTVDRRLDPIWKASLTGRVEGVEVKNVQPYAPPSISRDIGNHLLLGLRAGLTRDTRDSFIYPTNGSVFDVGYEQVGGDYAFPLATAEYTKFFSSKYFQREDGSGKHVVALRSQVSVAGTNTPVFERFYAGGFRSLRGFTFRGVGPSENNLMVGGRFSFLNTVEYQIPILPSDKLFFVTFLDHGTVERDIEIKDYRASVGFGFRIAVPALGPQPIALDFAFPISRRDTDNRQLFSFYVGLFGGS